MAQRGEGQLAAADLPPARQTTLNSGFVRRVADGIRYAVAGVTPSTWMGPSQPLPPQAQEVQGRQFDYPVGYNLRIDPRAEDERGISFHELRALADGYDLLRLVIETRKDQIERIGWNIKARQKPGGKQVANAGADSRIEKIEAALQFPDGFNDFATWLRILLEELLVIDAPCIYRRKNRAGDPLFEVISGDTIKRIIDDSGRTPLPPSPAYQQILKGIPAADYTTDQMLYLPRNPRANRVLGFSPVEQIVMTVNIGLRKQVSTLAYWTEGSMPDALIGVPETWGPEQMNQWQGYWDSMLAGNLDERRKTRFIPGAMKILPTKQIDLKDEFDEWLARIVCYAFSISPTAFTKQVNRATAETAKQAAAEEGLAPLLGWVKRLMDRILAQDFGAADLEFSWQTESEQDPLQQAQIDKILVGGGIMTINEVRSNRGLDPVQDGDSLIVETAQGGVLLRDIVNPPEPADAAEVIPPPPMAVDSQDNGVKPSQSAKKPTATEKVEKLAGTERKPLKATRPSTVRARGGIAKAVNAFFDKHRDKVANRVATSYAARLGKRDDDGGEPDDVIGDTADIPWKDLLVPVNEVLAAFLKKSGAEALIQVGVSDQGITDQVNEDAVNWARQRSAELIGKRYDAGKLIDNPNPEHAISETTRDGLRSLVKTAKEQGWSNDKLANEIRTSALFSPERARLIARTETAMADSAGNMIAWKNSGVVIGKRWLLSSNHDVDDLCNDNAEEGVIPLEGPFPTGTRHPHSILIVAALLPR